MPGDLENDSEDASPPRDHTPQLDRMAAASQLDFDIAFFDQILAQSPDFVDVLRCQGGLLSRKGLHERALQLDRRLHQITPDDPIVCYNLACSLARNACVDEALTVLRQALQHGYQDLEYLETDGDLDVLRGEPAYEALLREFGVRS